MSKFTDSLQTINVFNDYDFYGDEPYIFYRPYERMQVAGWMVTKRGLDLGSHWSDNNGKLFMLDGANSHREQKQAALERAQQWASERFGVAAWVKGPYGSYGPADYTTARIAELKERVGRNE